MDKIRIYGLPVALLTLVMLLAACSGGVNRGDSPRTLMVSKVHVVQRRQSGNL